VPDASTFLEVSTTLEGAKAAQRRLQRMDRIGRARVMFEAVKKAAAPMAARARELAPIRTGALRKAIELTKVRGVGGDQTVFVYTVGLGQLTKKSDFSEISLFKGPTFYAGILEYGAKTRGIRGLKGKGKGQPPGFKAFRYLRRAFRQKRQIARFNFSDHILRELVKEARR
jgi:hypothetical protein